MLLGFKYLLSGFTLITRPGIKRFVLMPAGISVIIFSVLFFIFWHYLAAFNVWFSHFLPAWLHWFAVLLSLIFFACYFLVFIYSFVMLSNIISAPFNSLLAEKIEQSLTGRLPRESSVGEVIRDIPRVIGRQCGVLIYYVPRACLLLLLFFIPVVQALAGVVWFLFHAWYLALTYLDYPADNHRVTLQATLAWQKQHRSTCLGMGSGILVMSMIPVLNFLAMPVSVAAAVNCWVDLS